LQGLDDSRNLPVLVSALFLEGHPCKIPCRPWRRDVVLIPLLFSVLKPLFNPLRPFFSGGDLVLGPSGDDPSRKYIAPHAGGSRSRVPPDGGAKPVLAKAGADAPAAAFLTGLRGWRTAASRRASVCPYSLVEIGEHEAYKERRQ
jgi:hypothetical protein